MQNASNPIAPMAAIVCCRVSSNSVSIALLFLRKDLPIHPNKDVDQHEDAETGEYADDDVGCLKSILHEWASPRTAAAL
jgi:hypothetical protein